MILFRDVLGLEKNMVAFGATREIQRKFRKWIWWPELAGNDEKPPCVNSVVCVFVVFCRDRRRQLGWPEAAGRLGGVQERPVTQQLAGRGRRRGGFPRRERTERGGENASPLHVLVYIV